MRTVFSRAGRISMLNLTSLPCNFPTPFKSKCKDNDLGIILSLEAAQAERLLMRAAGEQLVFTNGHFDLLHVGHLDYLEKARALGDALFVGLNGDLCTARLKGEGRP